MNKRKPLQSKSEISTVYYLYTILAAVLIPLFTEDRYFNITEAKADMFCFGTACILIYMLVLCFINRKKEPGVRIRKEIIVLLAFLMCTFMSSLLSYSFGRSFLGADGWRVGLYTIMSLSIIFVYLSERPADSAFMMKVISVINIFIYGLVITDSMGIDIFGMHEMMLPNQYYDYVSTIGNVNQMSGYLCLTVIYLFVTVLTEKKSGWRRLSEVALILGMFSVILCKSDSFYLGAGLCAFAMIHFLFEDKQMAVKTITLGIVFCLISLFIRYSGLFREKIEEIDGISQIVLNHCSCFC